MMNAPTKSALVAAVVGLLTLPSLGWAQAIDFSGTWSFDAAKSTGRPEPVSLAGGEAPEINAEGRVGGRGGRGGRGAPADGAPAEGAQAGCAQGGGGRAGRPVDAFRLVIKQTASTAGR